MGVTKKLLDEINEERIRQDKKYGGTEKDDEQSPLHWTSQIKKRASRANGDFTTTQNTKEYRRRMLQIAALAVAAVDSIDRKQAAADKAQETIDNNKK